METSKQNDIKFIFKNIGAIEYAEVPLNDLTMIVGKNSTSKTYLTYIIWGFLDFIYEYNSLTTEFIQQIMFKDGVLKQQINLSNISDELINHFMFVSKLQYSQQRVYQVLAIDDKDRLKDFIFDVELNNITLDYKIKIDSFDVNQIQVIVDIVDEVLSFSLIKPSDYEITTQELQYISGQLLIYILRHFIKQIFPQPFIITSERTGIGVFYKEIIRHRMNEVELIKRSTAKISSAEAFVNTFARYPAPVSENMNTILDLFNTNNLIGKKYFPESVINYLKTNLVHGKYVFNKELNEIFYSQDNDNQSVYLPYYLTSSSVKSHLLLDSYIRYYADSGRILIIDEPELNLHPDNLRHMARLLAMLVNAGVKLLFTTHSDYIIKELNNLIMLESLPDEARDYAIKQIAKETKTEYQPEMFLAKDKVTCIIAEQNAKTHIVRTKEAPINEFGIDAKIIDDEINRIMAVDEILTNLIDG